MFLLTHGTMFKFHQLLIRQKKSKKIKQNKIIIIIKNDNDIAIS